MGKLAFRHRRLTVFGLAALAGCAALPQPPVQPLHYDLGLLPDGPGAPDARPAPQRPPLRLDVTAATGLAESGSAMLYRLAYINAQQIYAYQQARWSQPPAQLLARHLLHQLAQQRPVLTAGADPARASGGAAPALLRVELEEFCQVFDAPETSAAVVQVRATLLAPGAGAGTPHLGQKLFAVRQSAPSPDAAGAAGALSAASAIAIRQIGRWLEQSGR